MALILAGKIAPLDRSDPEAVFKGCLFIDDDAGTIDSIVKGAVPPKAQRPPAFADADVIDVGDAFVLPGLIDLHNHIGYNALPLWTEPSQKDAFLHHDSWTRAPTYQKSISWPAKALAKAAPEALLGYVQLRALVGGTTSIQGWPTANRPAIQSLRNIDDGPDGTANRDLILTSALTKLPPELAQVARAQRKGVGFIYHCAEGQLGSIVKKEFADAADAGCLDGPFVGIHCNAITKADWSRWSKPSACAIAWSPFSNLWLYGSTTDIVAAKARKVTVCLGSDWGPSGTKNIQGELKVAALVARKAISGISNFDLVRMVTANPGDALMQCWKKTAGRLEPGSLADVTVFRPKSGKDVWTQVVESTEDDIMLVVYDGQLRYGDANLMKKSRRPTSPITIAGRKRLFYI
ncbi:MAG: amidohydrolase family protein, partial [Usitatibacter sp.]